MRVEDLALTAAELNWHRVSACYMRRLGVLPQSGFAGDKQTSRSLSGKLPRTPFVVNFQFAGFG
jgi:hypothetical protein